MFPLFAKPEYLLWGLLALAAMGAFFYATEKRAWRRLAFGRGPVGRVGKNGRFPEAADLRQAKKLVPIAQFPHAGELSCLVR